MKLKLFEDMICNSKSCKKGKTVEVSNRDAKYLIATGRAEVVKTKAKPRTAKPKTETNPTQSND